MDIRLYNSLTNKIEPFTTLEPNKVSMYVCGPTVYNYPHLGNMRPVVVFDVLRRFLEYVGYQVTYVSNLTDVDDKIIKAAKNENKSEKELTDFYIKAFQQTSKDIGSKLPNITPRVTEYIPQIIDYIFRLIDKGAAYVVDNDVYFRVSKISDYGALSNINIDDLKVGARIEENSKKESPLDFVLWKKTNEGISWDSPWGKGRPGWHTECCVMNDTIFPRHYIDIHGGGYDLKFPHHENEIAQAEAMNGNKIAKYWIHNGFINLDNEKMSKSLGNVVLAKDAIDKFGGAVVRMAIVSTQYRMPVNFSDDTIKEATQIINKINAAIKQTSLKLQINDIDLSFGKAIYINKFLDALADDLNTANALTEVYELIKLLNVEIRKPESDLNLLNDYFKTLNDMLDILGISHEYTHLTNEDKNLYKDYLEAKKQKDFATSDKIRDFLTNRGIL